MFKLFSRKNKQVIAEYKLSNQNSTLVVESNNLSKLTEQELLLFTVLHLLPTALFLADTATGRTALFIILKSIVTGEQKQMDPELLTFLPPIKDFTFKLFLIEKSGKKSLFLNSQKRPVGVRNDEDFVIMMTAFLFYLLDKIDDKKTIDSFFQESYAVLQKIDLRKALATYSTVKPVVTKYFNQLDKTSLQIK